MYYILFNPKSKKKSIDHNVSSLYRKLSKNNECYKINLMELIGNEKPFIEECEEEDSVIICGGDGTLDIFLNKIYGCNIKCKLFLHPCGSGNDFARDFKGNLIDVTKYVNDLPKVSINNEKTNYFINGVGIGVDAVVCRSQTQCKNANIKGGYFKIALKSFKSFIPYSLDLEIDGEKKHFDNVWFFVVNHGRFFGGGMNICPDAKRDDDVLDLCIVHDLPILKLCIIFPLVFLGKVKMFKKHVFYKQVKQIKAYPQSCYLLQRDGEVEDGVNEIIVER